MKAFHEQQIQQARIASERAAEAELIAHASKLGESSAVNTWREAFGDSQIIALANACLPELPRAPPCSTSLTSSRSVASSPSRSSRSNPSNSPRKPNNQHRKTSAREREQSEPSLTTRKQP